MLEALPLTLKKEYFYYPKKKKLEIRGGISNPIFRTDLRIGNKCTGDVHLLLVLDL